MPDAVTPTGTGTDAPAKTTPDAPASDAPTKAAPETPESRRPTFAELRRRAQAEQERADREAAAATYDGDDGKPKPDDADPKTGESKDPKGQAAAKPGDAKGGEQARAKDGDAKPGDPKPDGPVLLKVDGKEVPAPDWAQPILSDPARPAEEKAKIRRDLQKAMAADARLQEAAQGRKQLDALFARLGDDPVAVFEALLKRAGGDRDLTQVATEYLSRQLELQGMSDEERQRLSERQELERLRAEREQRARADQQAQFEAKKREHAQRLDRQITEAVAQSGLPTDSPAVYRRVIHHLREGALRGDQLEPADVVDLVKADMASERSGAIGGLEGNALVEALGKDVVERVVKHERERARAAQQRPQVAPDAPRQRPEGSGRPRKSFREIREEKWGLGRG